MKTVCIIIPFFNETDGIPSLSIALEKLKSSKYQFQWLFIDDGSTDDTFVGLQKLADKLGNTKLIRHATNKNLGGALQTAARELPRCDYVAYLDSDCTYSPDLIFPLLDKLDNGADLVTASPYHPKGRVIGVPGWRLFLSKSLSQVYRALTGARIHTFTAMVRAEKYECVKKTMSQRNDFTHVTEVMLKALRLHLRVEEVPAELSTRIYGQSKMKVMKTIFQHFELIGAFITGKI